MVTKEQIQQMANQEFTAMDQTSDGQLSPAEFSSCTTRAALALQPVSGNGGKGPQSDAAFKKADGKLDTREYLAAAEKEFMQQSAASHPQDVPIYFIWMPATAVPAMASSGGDDAAMTPNPAASRASIAFGNQDNNGDGAVAADEWHASNAVINPELLEMHSGRSTSMETMPLPRTSTPSEGPTASTKRSRRKAAPQRARAFRSSSCMSIRVADDTALPQEHGPIALPRGTYRIRQREPEPREAWIVAG
jgi:hypothetical protein